jgi:hypothetical protein
MFFATVNKPKQLLHLNFIGAVRLEELERHREEITELLADLKTGFRLLTDLGRADSIGVECAAELGKMMQLFDQKGVGLVVRVIPDPSQDIGLGILALFHYHHRPITVTCENMIEAIERLGL